MNRRQRMESLFASLHLQTRGRPREGSFLRGWTFPQEQSVACSPGMNLGVGRPRPGLALPGGGPAISGKFRLPHSWG
jgi:hypothetical protein